MPIESSRIEGIQYTLSGNPCFSQRQFSRSLTDENPAHYKHPEEIKD